MCVAVYSPKGVDAPTEEQIRKMFKKNPDGAGYAFEEGNTVHFKKGFMTVDDLLEDLGPLEKWKDRVLAMHFRIGTAGKNDQKTTHPFPLSNNFGELRKLEGEGPVLFHNGVISGFGGIIDPLASDTQDFVAGVASKLLMRPNLPSKVVQKAITSIIGSSRLLLMYGKGKAYTFGDWETKDGNLYSNLLWDVKEFPKTYSYPSSTYKYGQYYEEENDGPYISDYAWPSETHQWLQTNESRGEQIKKVATLCDDGTYSFVATPGLKWKCNENYTEWWTTIKGRQMKIDFEKEVAAEDELYSLYDTDYMAFEDPLEMEEWASAGIMFKDHTAELYGMKWYLDEVNCEAFTREGAKLLTECKDLKKALRMVELLGHLPQDEYEMRMMEQELKYKEKEACV